MEPFQGRQNVKQFRGLAAVADGERDVSVRDNPKIAVQRVDGTEHKCRRTGTGKCCCYFFANLPGFSHAKHDYFPAGFHRFKQDMDSLFEPLIQSIVEPSQLLDLYPDYPLRFLEIIHSKLGEKFTPRYREVTRRRIHHRGTETQREIWGPQSYSGTNRTLNVISPQRLECRRAL